MQYSYLFLLLVFFFLLSCKSGTIAQSDVPAIYSNIYSDSVGSYYMLDAEGNRLNEIINEPKYTLEMLKGAPYGYDEGIRFDFKNAVPEGTLYYGFIPYGDSRHPLPVYSSRTADIERGQAQVNISRLNGRYDMIGWEEKGYGTLGYRVEAADGTLLYIGRVAFKGTGPFEVGTTVIEGPFVNLIHPTGATISCTTNGLAQVSIKIDGKTFSTPQPSNQHEIAIDGLMPDKDYIYEISYDGRQEQYALHTAPVDGARTPFTFAYASDSRNGNGGGERNLYGANYYIMKKIMALATQEKVAFMQFSGDLIDGYLTSPQEMDLQYANWKRAVEPFAHYFPIYKSMGNHEALTRTFNNGSRYGVSVDRFPFDTESAEAIFANNFVNPTNGPVSEDGAAYDPNPNKSDFPSYSENVFHYRYNNVAVVVLNSNYMYAPSTSAIPFSSGGLHAYIMNQQLKWFKNTLQILEGDETIDHIFVTQHTPFFPNGGHVSDDMWYRGNNTFRTWVNGKPLDKGIIERRDELLEAVVNNSDKVLAILTGDEHNFALTSISPEMERYPNDWDLPRVTLSRTIYQVNNGAAGAPYYAQEATPWSPHVSGFTTQNALVLFDVDDNSVFMRVLNPDTLEPVISKKLR